MGDVRPVPVPRRTLQMRPQGSPPLAVDIGITLNSVKGAIQRRLSYEAPEEDSSSSSGEDEYSQMSSPGSIRVQCTVASPTAAAMTSSSASSDSEHCAAPSARGVETRVWGSRAPSQVLPFSSHSPVEFPRDSGQWKVPSHPCSPAYPSLRRGEEGGERGAEYLVNEIVVSSPTGTARRKEQMAASSTSPSIEESSSSTPSPSLPLLSLLEQLIRTHPIWYLQEVDRHHAEHILRAHSAGTFVVRGCSRPSAMALSIRLPPSELPAEVDHLLLVHAAPGGLRLQSSPLVFRSLPLLLEYFATQRDELRVQLRLPSAVTDCSTTSELQRIALMGIDFWSSPLCMRRGSVARCSGTTTSSAYSSSTSDSRRDTGRIIESERAKETKGRDNSAPAPIRGRRAERGVQLKRTESTGGVHGQAPSTSSGSAKSSMGKAGGSGLVALLHEGREAMASQLAHCALFLPWRRGKVTSSRSAMSIRDWRENIDGGTRSNGKDGVSPREFEWSLPGGSSTFKPHGSLSRDRSIDDRLHSAVARRMADHHLQREERRAGGLERAHSTRENNSPYVSSALRPPVDALDPANTRQCVEELRRKRLQSTAELLGGPGEGECSSVLRRKKADPPSPSARSSARSHRLSAPSLPDTAIPSTAIRESAKALRERMDRNEQGELSTINEGLITPVVRRKMPVEAVEESEEESSTSEQPLLLFNRAFHTDRVNRPLRPVENREEFSQAPPVAAPSSIVVTRVPLAVPSPSLPGHWNAVTRELRTRQQKIAKVLPTPQTPRVSAEQKMTIRDSIPSASGVVQGSPLIVGRQSGRISDYAQLNECSDVVNGNVEDDDSVSVAGTIFDEPWDSNTWENLLVCAGEGQAAGRVIGQSSILEEEEEDEGCSGLAGDDDRSYGTLTKGGIASPAPGSRSISRHSLLSMDHTGSLRRPAKIDAASHAIQSYIVFLASAGGTFSNSLDRFIECTRESTEKDARLVAKNVRQFMNGMKNYLMKQGEGDLHAILARETGRLDQNTILNMDTILEDSLGRLVLKPLCDHIYDVIRAAQRSSGALPTLFASIEKTKALSPQQLGLPVSAVSPSAEAIEQLRILCRKMQSAFSPHRKLELLLKATRLIFSAQQSPSPGREKTMEKGAEEGRGATPPGDELVSWLVWLISRSLSVAAECEAIYMNELLPTQLRQSGDGAFYLSALDSAIRVLASPGGVGRLAEGGTMTKMRDELSSGSCLIRVAVPDEAAGCVSHSSFPVVEDTTAARLARLVAHHHAITNPEDYGLYLVTDGFEQCLAPGDSMDCLRSLDRPYLLAYKRHEAKLAWPVLR